MGDPQLLDSEEGGIFLFDAEDLTAEQAEALMLKLAPGEWGIRIRLDNPPALVYFRDADVDAGEDEERMYRVDKGHPGAEAVWESTFEEYFGPEDPEPDATVLPVEVHPDQLSLAPQTSREGGPTS